MISVEPPHWRCYSAPLEAPMRHRFVRDKRSKLILDDLAQYRGGNRSRVVREALVALAGMETRLDKIEEDPAFQEMMRRSDADIRAGRAITASALRASSWESS